MARKKGKAKAESEAAALLKDLQGVLDELGVRVTNDRRVEGRGGFCLVDGEPRVILNSRLPASDQAEVILEELERFDLSGVYLAPELRRRIEGDAAEGDLSDTGTQEEETPGEEPPAATS